jgi:nucleoside-triphosphatase THEP1
VIFLTGKRHAGKTSRIMDLVRQARGKGLRVSGIASPGLWTNGQRAGFDLLELDTGDRYALSRRIDGMHSIPYMFDAESLGRGKAALAVSRCKDADLTIVDEVGPLELKGGGWNDCLPGLLSVSNSVQIWVVRQDLTHAVQDHYHITAQVIDFKDISGLDQVLGSFV